MSASWPFVGREEELATVAGTMHRLDTAGLIVAGPSGTGKTQLALEVLSRLDRSVHTTRWIAATPATRPLPLGAVAPILPAELPGGIERVDLLRLVTSLIAANAPGKRLVLGVDDAHLLDTVSAALVHHMVLTRSAFVLMTMRTDEPVPEDLTYLWRNHLAERIDLQPLPHHDVERTLSTYLDGPVDGLTVQRLEHVSAGNLLFLRELVLSGQRAGALHRKEGIWQWRGPWVLAPRQVELVEQRLRRLGPDEQDALESLAYAEPIDVEVLCHLTTPGTVERLEVNGLCRVEQHADRLMVHLAHPLYGEVLRSRAPALRARRRQQRLAEVVERGSAQQMNHWLRIALWRLKSGKPVSADVLISAARQAWALSDLRLAEHLARHALQAGATLAATEILWRSLMLQNRLDEADQLLIALEGKVSGDRERARVAIGRAYLCWGRHPGDEHLALLESTLDIVVDQRSRDDLTALRAVMYGHASQHDRAAALATDLLVTADGSARAHAHIANAFAQFIRGDIAAAGSSLHHALTSPGWEFDSPWLGEVALLWQCEAALARGDLTSAETTARETYERGVRNRTHLAIMLGCLCLGKVCRARGHLQQALRWLNEGLANSLHDIWFRFQLLGESAHAHALRGDATKADQALADAVATRRPTFTIYHHWLDLARPWVVAAKGDLTEAANEAMRAASMFRDTAPVYEAVALHDAARLGAAAAVAERLNELAASSTNALHHTYATHTDALRRHQATDLERASLDFEKTGMLLLAAEAGAEAAATHRRAGRPDLANRAAARATALASHCEEVTTPALSTLRAPQLTPRQRQIVELAAAGHTTEQIANRLVLSKRTVDNHLYQAYLKLGVHHRTELNALFPSKRRSADKPI